MRNQGVKSIATLLLCLSVIIVPAIAQKYHLGFLAGASNYQGDLIKEDFSLRALHMAVGIESRVLFRYGLSARGQLYAGTLSGSDAYYPERAHRGLSSQTSFIELSTYGGYNFFRLFDKHRKNPWGLHGLLGVGFLVYQVEVIGNIEKGVYTDTEHPFLNPSFGLGANLSYRLNANTELSYEMTHRTLMNDKIDGVSTSGTTGYDWFYLTNLTITTAF